MKGNFRNLIFFLCAVSACCTEMQAQSLSKGDFSSFVEYAATVHTGDNTPLWQVSNRQGLASLDNNTYLRGAAFYEYDVKDWRFNTGLDMAVAAGFTSTFVLQQAYLDVDYKWLRLSMGSKEMEAPLLNQQLSSGGLTWSGNARPIPQAMIEIPEYLQVLPRFAIKGAISYGWFTDNKYQRKKAGDKFSYTKNVKYHHKSAFARIGIPEGKWQFDIGLVFNVQFGGYQIADGKITDLGNSLKDYLNIFIPHRAGDDMPLGEQIAFEGNSLGSEYFRLTYKFKDFSLSAYLENYYEDLTGMGKLNGFDGLWGLEYKSNSRQTINGVVFEYYQTTNQSGPLHGLDDTTVKYTHGADNYYNNGWYPGWVHWGMGIGNPLVASPIYNKDGSLKFKYNRVRALHVGFSGDISSEWDYACKFSHNRTWGTVTEPLPDILENFSIFASFNYAPRKLKGWHFNASLAMDMGGIYGDNFGTQFIIRKSF